VLLFGRICLTGPITKPWGKHKKLFGSYALCDQGKAQKGFMYDFKHHSENRKT
jgi:hypothetical protein